MDGGNSPAPIIRRNSSGLNMLAASASPTTSPLVDVASLTSACTVIVPASVVTVPIDTAKKDEKKQKALWSLVKNTLKVTAALRGGVNTGNSTARSASPGTVLPPPPAKQASSSNSDPSSTDSGGSGGIIDHELRLSASFSTTSHPTTAISAIDGSLVMQRSTANSSIASTARSHFSDHSHVDGDGMTPRHHQCVEEIVPLMWLRGKPQEENSRGIAVANLLLRMSSASLTLRSTTAAAGDFDRSSRDKIAWSAWAGWDVDLSPTHNKDPASPVAAGITAASSSSSKTSTSEKLNKEPSPRKLISKNDCRSESAIYTGPSPMPPPVPESAARGTLAGDDADDENFKASQRVDSREQLLADAGSGVQRSRSVTELVDGSLPPPPQRHNAAVAAAVSSSSSSPSSMHGKPSRIAFSSSSKLDGNDSSGRDSSAGGNGTYTPSTQANTDVETKSRADSISSINSKSASLDAYDTGISTAKEEVLAMLNSNDVLEDIDFIATDTRHVSKAMLFINQSAASDSDPAVTAAVTAEIQGTIGATTSVTEAERLQMFGQMYKTAASMHRSSNAPKTNNRRQRSAFGGSFNVMSSSSGTSLIGNAMTATKLLLAERPGEGRILRTLSAGDEDNNSVETPRSARSSAMSQDGRQLLVRRAKSLRGVGGLEVSSSSASSSSSLPLDRRRSTSAGNLAAMVDGSSSISSPLFRQSSALSTESGGLICRLDSSSGGSFHGIKKAAAATAAASAAAAILLEYPEPAPAVSRLTIYGTLSQGIEYKFELLPPKANPFIGKKTRDGWFVKARGIFLNTDEEAEVLTQAQSELLLYRQKHQTAAATLAMNSILPFVSVPSSTTATTDDATTGFTSGLFSTTPTRTKRPGSSAVDGFSVSAEAKARSGSFVLGSSGKDDIAAAAAAATVGSLAGAVVNPTMTSGPAAAGAGAGVGPSTVCFAPDQYADECNTSSSNDAGSYRGASGGHGDQVPPDSMYLITLTAGFAVKNRVVTEELLRFMMDFSLTED